MATTIGRQPETRRSRQTRKALVEGARTVIRRTGNLSPEAVSTEAGVAPATFYLHFANKDEALAAAFDAVLEELHTTTAAALDIEHLLGDGLERVVGELARGVVKGFRRDAGVVRLAISRLPEAEPVQRVYRHWEEATLAMLTSFVRSGARAGLVRPGHPETMASALLVSVQGYQNPLLLQPGTSAILDELVGMLLALLRPGPT